MPIVCTCQNVIACGAVGVGGSTDANCAAHTPTFFRTLTANEKISLRDLVLTVSGTLGGLRNWVAQQYSRRGISLAAWTDPTITANQTPVRLVHFTEVNTRIDALTLCRCNCNRATSGGCGCNSNNTTTSTCGCVAYSCGCVGYSYCGCVADTQGCSGETCGDE